MSRNFIVVLGSLVALTLVFSSFAFAQEEGHQPEIIFEEVRYDMGEVFEQDSYKHTFVVRNAGKADLIIKSVRPG